MRQRPTARVVPLQRCSPLHLLATIESAHRRAQRQEDVPAASWALIELGCRVTVIARGFPVVLEPTFATQIDLQQRWKVVVDVHHISQFLAAS